MFGPSLTKIYEISKNEWHIKAPRTGVYEIYRLFGDQFPEILQTIDLLPRW